MKYVINQKLIYAYLLLNCNLVFGLSEYNKTYNYNNGIVLNNYALMSIAFFIFIISACLSIITSLLLYYICKSSKKKIEKISLPLVI